MLAFVACEQRCITDGHHAITLWCRSGFVYSGAIPLEESPSETFESRAGADRPANGITGACRCCNQTGDPREPPDPVPHGQHPGRVHLLSRGGSEGCANPAVAAWIALIIADV